MKKNKLVWVVLEDDGEVLLCPNTKPEHKMHTWGDGFYWEGDGHDIDLCYDMFKKVTGLTLKVDVPVRLRFSVEVYKR